MGDDLGEDWWDTCETNADSEDVGEIPPKHEEPLEHKGLRKRKASEVKKKTNVQFAQKESLVLKKEDPAGQKPKRRRKKKTITDVLATSEAKPGSPSDLQNLVLEHFSTTRSIIELEDLKLLDSCFLSSNDLTHSLSSYLKGICPKWAKVQKHHTEKRSVVLLIVCSSALRTIHLIRQLTTFKGEAKVLKLFAKHIKVEEQMKLLEKTVTHIGVGTPGRLTTLIEKEGLGLKTLQFLVLDWNWRDQKQRRMVDVPEVKGDLLKLLDSGILKCCREGTVKVGLF